MSSDFAKKIAVHRKNRREKLLRAAAAAFLENGLKQSTMDQVARSVGVSKIVFYRYFGSKDKLIHAILESIVGRLLEADRQQVGWWTDLVPLTLKIARENKDALTLLIRHAAHDPKYGSHFQRLRDVLVERSLSRQHAIFSESLNDQDAMLVSPIFLAETTVAFFLESYVRWLETGTPEEDAQFIDWVIKSVRAMGFYGIGSTPPA